MGWIPPRFRRVAVSAAAVVVAFSLYQAIAVPLVEPQIQAPVAAVGSTNRTSTSDLQQDQERELLNWFPSSHWVLQKRPKVLENSKGKLLLDEYKTLPDGRVRVFPCVMVFLPERGSMPEEERVRQAIILEAPDGATLEFDQPFELTRGSVGRLVGGRLDGPITIHSDYRQEGPADDLLIETRDVDLLPELIASESPLKFRFGGARGSGQGMRVELLPAVPTAGESRYGPRVGSVKSFAMVRDVQVRLLLGSRGAAEESLGGRRQGLPVPLEMAGGQQTPVEVSSQGPFLFDFQQNLCTFSENVDVLRIRKEGPGDQMSCQKLSIFFKPKEQPAVDAATTPAKPATGPGGLGKLVAERIEALGQPVVIRSPVDQLFARCRQFDYTVATRQVVLRGNGEVVEFEAEGKQVRAGELHYEPGPEGRIGRVLATGPGQVEGPLPNDSSRKFLIRFAQEMRSHPHETEQLVVIRGDSLVDVQGTGKLQGDELTLWLKEHPKGEAPEGRARLDSSRMTPRRLLATGRVQFDSPRLTGGSETLEVWFTQQEGRLEDQARLRRPPLHKAVQRQVEHWPVVTAARSPGELLVYRTDGQPARLIPVQYREGRPRPATTPRAVAQRPVPQGAAAPRGPAGAASPLDQTFPDLFGGSGQQRYEVAGKSLRALLYMPDRTPELREASVEGMARFGELETSKPGEKPLLVQGDRLHVMRRGENVHAVAVTGAPARFDGRGLTLTGDVINMDQAANRLWIDGPGALGILIERGEPAEKERKEQFDVVWRGRMSFDGQQAEFEKGVDAHRFDQELKTERLQVVFDRRTEFANPRQAGQPQVEVIRCHDGVWAHGKTFDERGLSIDERMEVRDLYINHLSGEFSANGPGWLTRVTRGPPADEANFAEQRRGGAGLPLGNDVPDGLNYLNVRFEESVTGNFQRRQVRFNRQVRAVYGPVDNWEGIVDPDGPEGLGPKDALLTCDKMEGVQMAPPGFRPHMELEATGNVIVEGQTYTAQAYRITYNQAKDLLVLESGGRATAELSRQQRVGGPVSKIEAGKILYWKNTNRVEVDDGKFVDLGQLPPQRPKDGKKN